MAFHDARKAVAVGLFIAASLRAASGADQFIDGTQVVVPSPSKPSPWQIEGDLYVGDTGIGVLTVENGGVVVNNRGYIGHSAGSLGSVKVTGPGSRWIVSEPAFGNPGYGRGRLIVGHTGSGTMTIQDGGVVTDRLGWVGYDPGSSGLVIVSGAGSEWQNRPAAPSLFYPSFLVVGFSGSGELRIENGGKVSADYIQTGLVAGSSGTIDVAGVGSTLSYYAPFFVGLAGKGTLTVRDGGAVEGSGIDSYVAVGNQTGSIGTMLVTDAGSTYRGWGVQIGVDGKGTLTIARAGAVHALGAVVVGQNVGSFGILNLGAAAGDAPVEPGLLDAPSIYFGTGSGSIVFNHISDNYRFAPSISGGGSVEVYSGTTILNGASTYTGATTVYGGKLVVGDGSHPNASLASVVTLKSGASLGGIGTLGGLVVENGAEIAPGNSIGTLNIAGDVSLAAGSTYEVEIAGNGTSDRIAVTGKATLGGGKVGISALDPQTSYQDGQIYTILTAAGGVIGGFDPAVLSRSAFLDATLVQSANAVDLKIALKETGPVFGKAANTYNQKQTAGALDTLQQSGQSLKLYNKLLLLSANAARAAFDGLSGEVNASTVTGLIEDSRFTRDAINDRLRSAFETVGAEPLPLMGYGDDAKEITTASVPSERYGAWGSVFGSWGHFGSDGNAAKLNRSTGGFVAGVDGLITDDVRLGFLAGYSHSSLKVDDRRSSASTDNYHLGIYGGAEWGALALRSGLAYTWSQIDSSRQVAFPGFTDSLTGDYRTGTTQVFGELGYDIKAGAVAFEPFANLAYVNVHTNGFTEQGGASALTVHSGSNDSTFTTLGFRAATDFDIGAARATVRGMIGWRHAYGDVTPIISQAFTGSNAFTIASTPIAKDAAIIKAGLDFAITPQAMLGVSYHGQVGSRARDHGVRADLRIKF